MFYVFCDWIGINSFSLGLIITFAYIKRIFFFENGSPLYSSVLVSVVDRIRCMKSSRTLQCKICTVERKEILHRMQQDKNKVINDNSDIYSSCGSRFHKFGRTLEPETLRKRMTQKKVPSTRHSKQKRNRFSFDLDPQGSPVHCIPCTPTAAPVTPEPASPQATPVFLYTNVPDLPYRSPTTNPTNLELAQVRAYEDFILQLPSFDV